MLSVHTTVALALLGAETTSSDVPLSVPFAEGLEPGPWRVVLASPGGPLPFRLDVAADGTVHLVNGTERIPVPEVEATSAGTVSLELPHYDSRLEGATAGGVWQGEWVKRASGADSWTRMTFRAERGDAPRFAPEPGTAPSGAVDGRWRVEFESSDEPAIGVFETLADGTLAGTFLTTTGDYRYLAGTFAGDRLRLSVFDGAHAFLFDARLGAEGELSGDFWSRDTWHETWTSTSATIRCPPSRTCLRPNNLERRRVGLDDLVFSGSEDGNPTPGRRADLRRDAPAHGHARSSAPGARTATTRRPTWSTSTSATATGASGSSAWPSS